MHGAQAGNGRKQTEAAAPSKPRRKGLAVALASVLLIACGLLGYLFLGDDGDDGEDANETSNPDTTVATFTPGQPWTVPTASIEMLWCKPGAFLTGSPESEVGREEDHQGNFHRHLHTRPALDGADGIH